MSVLLSLPKTEIVNLYGRRDDVTDARIAGFIDEQLIQGPVFGDMVPHYIVFKGCRIALPGGGVVSIKTARDFLLWVDSVVEDVVNDPS